MWNSETPGVPSNSDDGTTFKSFRDGQGRILRQGARFRIFAYSKDDNGALSAPQEVSISDDIVGIEWRVHMANRKASFFTFYGQEGASDNYAARTNLPPNHQIKRPDDQPQRDNLRNAAVASADRINNLDIDPGEQLISTAQPAPVELTNKKDLIPIKSLGTLLLDEKGRLVVLGGYGESNSTASQPIIDEYANNDTWFDDASDGSVKARIRFRDGTTVDADPAWVIVGPPDFAPGIGNVVRLFDTLWDTAVRGVDFQNPVPPTPAMNSLLAQKQKWQANGGKSLSGFKPSFTNDIYPLLKRAMGVRDVHISGTTGNPNYHKRLLGNWGLLATNSPEGARLRNGIMFMMRDPDDQIVKWDAMPRGLGDEYTALDANPDSPSPRSFLSLTRIQLALLREWGAGNFIEDWPGAEPTFTPKPDPSPDDLDYAAAENCVGGPFYPGIDVSWLIRVKDLFSEPFRLKIPPQPEAEIQSPPLKIGALEFRPGFFSQQMALPWQADFYDCHKEQWFDPDKKELYFMWWTAHRPDDVFPSGSRRLKSKLGAKNLTIRIRRPMKTRKT